MNYRNHFYFGVACWLGCAPALGLRPDPINLSVAGMAALLPDIDHPQSKVGRWVPAVGQALTHRGLTHSFLALLVLAGVLWWLYGHYPQWLALWVAIGVGYGSGILGDVLTVGGVQLLWPMRPRWRVPVLGKSGGRREVVFTALCIGAALSWWVQQRPVLHDLQTWAQEVWATSIWLWHWWQPVLQKAAALLADWARAAWAAAAAAL
ncbi:MAG: metal-dependent hydrolase [Comamonas sp.]|nr:metal-dependent hydrolase [Comamonas sp.]